MRITLENIGKRFQNDWIFREIEQSFESGDRVAIYGSNGSGKSTLLQIISGYLTPSKGRISWDINGKSISVDDVNRYVTLATPYMNMYEDFTLRENIEFFSKFKSLRGKLPEEVAAHMGLEKNMNKALKFYSSGMKQRVKLGLTIMADTPILLLDEPSSHLDAQAIDWYQQLVKDHLENRIVFVASNREESETAFCTKSISVEEYK